MNCSNSYLPDEVCLPSCPGTFSGKYIVTTVMSQATARHGKKGKLLRLFIIKVFVSSCNLFHEISALEFLWKSLIPQSEAVRQTLMVMKLKLTESFYSIICGNVTVGWEYTNSIMSLDTSLSTPPLDGNKWFVIFMYFKYLIHHFQRDGQDLIMWCITLKWSYIHLLSLHYDDVCGIVG